ncbi:unnamed protein product [marine sediment metagenome]|uniref:Uncharacterized protein n=1 Tax=marine sediment metagenome TaxID=412755 RepID=X1PJC8_9ZZZZ
MIMELLIFLIEHPEIIVGIGIAEIIAIILLELESIRYYKKMEDQK